MSASQMPDSDTHKDKVRAYTLGWTHQSGTTPLMLVHLVCFNCSHTFAHPADNFEDLRKEIPRGDLAACPNCGKGLIIVPKKPRATAPLS